MSRVHDRWLGIVGPRTLRTDGEVVERVVLTQAARVALRGHLGVTGAVRTGLLFGQVQDGTLRVQWAAQGSYPAWESPPLQVDGHYVLGWADALATINPGVQWVGQWLMYADAQQHPSLEDWAWLEDAQGLGLFGEQQIFVFAGWSEGRLAVSSYISRDEPERLETEFGDS
ncbi:hypothetical protein DESA109040_12090 [Deinococcus saxicola]|uniref:hypothetical protein n=1 Tax=Deinococcus saxicola TaxID=249406 RepID=UPI0039F0755C